MLHAAAKLVVNEHGGKFPENNQGLLGLPGIGRYTAAAIASIAFGEPVPVVDGNVERVLDRLGGKRLAGQATWQAAATLLDPERPGDFNQSMMELGATVCVPHGPRCLVCPVAKFCATRGELKSRLRTVPQKKRSIQFGLARGDGQVFLVQRTQQESLMPGMWELPECKDGITGKTLLSLRHSITVTDYSVRVVEMPPPVGLCGEWISASRLGSFPLTGLARKILRRMELV
jgi:A/G-specific adenine glycosylase